MDVQVQIHPRFFFPFFEFVKELEALNVQIPDPIGTVVKAINPETKLEIQPDPALSIAAKRRLYRKEKVSAGRFAFTQSRCASDRVRLRPPSRHSIWYRPVLGSANTLTRFRPHSPAL